MMNNRFGIPDHLFRVEQADDTWSMTPANYASRFIQEMEKRYGTRDRNWTYLGVDFSDGVPYVWFPGSKETPPRQHIAISLSAGAFSDRQRTVYQLAHECVHLLAPIVGGGAPVIEEGLATVFSEDMIEYWCGNTNKQAYTTTQKYIDAAARVRELLALVPDAIPRLRAIEPAFNQMTADTFTRAGLNVPPALVAALLARFPAD
ncbi:hypothetical protein [Cronobacter sakazakii]|uniref:hypothetical protein n=1 Tax=Cronobacter sakazakii TaxID=28141 RepID=UPI00111C5AF3|nr:hypothetical protein [Cronobacter sakazakii]MCI0186277.1 hypothetical protein [Cronobacter sakazakii]